MKDLAGSEYNYMLRGRGRVIRVRITLQADDCWGYNISETGRTAEEISGVSNFGVAFSKAKERVDTIFDFRGTYEFNPADNASYLRLQIFISEAEEDKTSRNVVSTRWFETSVGEKFCVKIFLVEPDRYGYEIVRDCVRIWWSRSESWSTETIAYFKAQVEILQHHARGYLVASNERSRSS